MVLKKDPASRVSGTGPTNSRCLGVSGPLALVKTLEQHELGLGFRV